MSHTLALEIPEEVFVPLTQKARAEGRTTEEVAADCLAASVGESLKLPDEGTEDKNGRQATTSQRQTDNPLYKIIGIAKGGRTDGAENHDRYLYREDPI
jgi:hypothetical protein